MWQNVGDLGEGGTGGGPYIILESSSEVWKMKGSREEPSLHAWYRRVAWSLQLGWGLSAACTLASQLRQRP